MKTHHVWDDSVASTFQSLCDAHVDDELFPVSDVLIYLAQGGKACLWIYKQWIWQIGSHFDIWLGSVLGGSGNADATDTAEIVSIDSHNVQQRKLMLVKYMNAMKRANRNALTLSTVIDAGRTKSRQKRFYMAVGTSGNIFGWTAPQVLIPKFHRCTYVFYIFWFDSSLVFSIGCVGNVSISDYVYSIR